MTPYPTRNDLPPAARDRVIALCGATLADSIDLARQLKHAHWNVKGPAFIALHHLFDELYDEVEELVDEIAERVVQLGGVAAGTLRLAAKASRLPEYELAASTGADHVRAVAAVLATVAHTMRAAIDEADGAGDQGTADLFTASSRTIDKALWLVEAHLHAQI